MSTTSNRKPTAAQRIDALEGQLAAILAAVTSQDEAKPAADRPNVTARKRAKDRVKETTAKGNVTRVPRQATDPTAERFGIDEDGAAVEWDDEAAVLAFECWDRYGVRVMPLNANGSRAKSWPVASLLTLLRDDAALDTFCEVVESFADAREEAKS